LRETVIEVRELGVDATGGDVHGLPVQVQAWDHDSPEFALTGLLEGHWPWARDGAQRSARVIRSCEASATRRGCRPRSTRQSRAFGAARNCCGLRGCGRFCTWRHLSRATCDGARSLSRSTS
jgi:hypothetical protein